MVMGDQKTGTSVRVSRQPVAPTVGRSTSRPAPVAVGGCVSRVGRKRNLVTAIHVYGGVIIRVGVATISNRLRAVGRAPIGLGNAARSEPSLVVARARR